MTLDDCITIMSDFVPITERQVIWGYTENDIEERWDLWQKWDSLYRLFGDGDSKGKRYKAKSSIPKPNITGKALDKVLDRMQ